MRHQLSQTVTQRSRVQLGLLHRHSESTNTHKYTHILKWASWGISTYFLNTNTLDCFKFDIKKKKAKLPSNLPSGYVSMWNPNGTTYPKAEEEPKACNTTFSCLTWKIRQSSHVPEPQGVWKTDSSGETSRTAVCVHCYLLTCAYIYL